jgi:hypothetical protein
MNHAAADTASEQKPANTQHGFNYQQQAVPQICKVEFALVCSPIQQNSSAQQQLLLQQIAPCSKGCATAGAPHHLHTLQDWPWPAGALLCAGPMPWRTASLSLSTGAVSVLVMMLPVMGLSGAQGWGLARTAAAAAADQGMLMRTQHETGSTNRKASQPEAHAVS